MTTTNTYYVSSGRKNGMYTLRVKWQETVYRRDSETGQAYPAGMQEKDYYVTNLTRDPDTANTKARLWLAENAPEARFEETSGFELSALARSDDWSWFRGGKYEGQTVEWVVENDFDYAMWAVEGMSGKRYEKTVALLREVPAVKARLAELAVEREAAEKAEEARMADEEARKAKVAEMVAPLVGVMADGRGGFRDSVAETLRRGELPSGRGESITIEILATIAGRRGSQAYNAEYDRVQMIFEAVKAL